MLTAVCAGVGPHKKNTAGSAHALPAFAEKKRLQSLRRVDTFGVLAHNTATLCVFLYVLRKALRAAQVAKRKSAFRGFVELRAGAIVSHIYFLFFVFFAPVP
jgi:hypothetical protein